MSRSVGCSWVGGEPVDDSMFGAWWVRETSVSESMVGGWSFAGGPVSESVVSVPLLVVGDLLVADGQFRTYSLS